MQHFSPFYQEEKIPLANFSFRITL